MPQLLYTIKAKPRYIHDCDACIFLGHLGDRLEIPDGDLYICNSSYGSKRNSIIVRHSSEPSDYFSMNPNVLQAIPQCLWQLINRAQELGVVYVKVVLKNNLPLRNADENI